MMRDPDISHADIYMWIDIQIETSPETETTYISRNMKKADEI